MNSRRSPTGADRCRAAGPGEEGQADAPDRLGRCLEIRVAACQINTVVGDLAGQRRTDPGGPGRGRGGRRRPGRVPRADRDRLPARGPAQPPGLRGRQPGRLRPRSRPPPARAPRSSATWTSDPGGHLLNAAALCAGGQVLGRYVKRLLPNYGVFDEQRWFTPGHGPAGALRGGRGAGRHLHLRGHVVRRRAHGRPGRGRRPAAGQPQRLPLLAGPPARSGWPSWPIGWPRPAAPSST